MTYKINKTDGTLLTEIVDSTVDQTSTDLTLIGKNVAGYGEFFNENLVKLLENFANTSSPSNPIAGQIWFDTATNRLKVYDGNGFRIGSGPIVQGTAPTNVVQGDMWIDSLENRLYFYTSSNSRYDASKIWNDSQGKSGFEIRTIFDTNNARRVIALLYVAESLIGIFSNSTIEFTPLAAISGFSGTIKPGFNASTLSGMKFNVRASSADALATTGGQLRTVNDFMVTNGPTSTSGTVTLTNPVPLVLGSGSFEVAANNTALSITSNIPGGDYKFRINPSGGVRDAITIKGSSERIGILNDNPQYNLDVAGSVRAQFALMLPKYSTVDRNARTLTSDNNGELIYNTTDNKVQAYADGIWVDLH
jgi:hypothetical protein